MESKNPFDKLVVLNLVDDEIKNNFDGETKYDPIAAPKICVAMAHNITNNICVMDFDRYYAPYYITVQHVSIRPIIYFRYKIISTVEIIEKKRQGIYSEVKFLRDIQKDKCVKRLFENNNFIAIVVVVGFYFE